MTPLEALHPVLIGLTLAFLTESMTEYLFGQALDRFPNLSPLRWLLQYVAAIVGVGLAFYYQVDLIALIGGDAVSPVGVTLSGLIIGRGANYFHQFVSQYLTSK